MIIIITIDFFFLNIIIYIFLCLIMLLFFCIMHVRIQDCMHAIYDKNDLFSRLFNNYMYILLHTYNYAITVYVLF